MNTSKSPSVSDCVKNHASIFMINNCVPLDLAFFRTVSALPLVDVKLTSKEAKQASFMTLVYHYLVYLVFRMLVTVKESLITKEFADKLAMARNDAQLDRLVAEIIEKQFQSPIKKGWNIPTLDQMEVEVAHLSSFWNDQRVSQILTHYKNSI